MRVWMILLIALASAAKPALAHGGGADSEGWSSLEPGSLAMLAVGSILYFAGFVRLRRRCGGRIAARRAGLAFVAAMLVALVTLDGPLDHLGAELFSAHMVQHLALMLVVAPLLVLARAGMVVFWALPVGERRWLGAWWMQGSGSALQPLFTAPLAIWVWFCGAFAFWHLPGPYDWALRNETVHVIEHLFFVLTAYGFWSVVIEPFGRRRLEHGSAMLFVAAAAIVSGLPGALMILSSRPFYAGHAEGAAAWGLTLVQDQQLGGLIMWIPGGLAYLAAISMLLLCWLEAAERRNLRLRPLAPLVCLLALLPLAGCDAPETHQAAATRIGNPDEGLRLIEATGCYTCHTIPGVDRMNGRVGPPLTHFRQRTIIAGMLPNTPANLVRWLRDPQSIVPGNAMPTIGLTEEQARDIAAYLYSIE